MKTPRGASESSTTSDNTTEFIDIVKKYDVVYNTHNPDYKNVEVKMKVWSQIAEEIGLSVDASKRKWKNLRDSYTKYLRSFRIGTKTSKKYQYWAHADHMEFLKPYQGPGRNCSNGNGNGIGKPNDDEDTECDLGYQVLTKAASSEEDVKISVSAHNTNTSTSSTPTAATQIATVSSAAQPMAIISPALMSAAAAAAAAMSAASATIPSTLSPSNSLNNSIIQSATLTSSSAASTGNTLVLPVPTLPSLPHVQLPLPPPQIAGSKAVLNTSLATHQPATTMPAQIFPLPHPLPNNVGGKAPIAMPASSTASSVGCLIIEPQLFASADTFKKELSTSGIGLFHSITPSPLVAASATSSTSCKGNPPLITKIRRVQPSPQTTAMNLSFSATPIVNAVPPPPPALAQSLPPMAPSQPPPTKIRKLTERSPEVDVGAILQANRDLDANTLFFLSLARTVRAMPTKFQSLAKMRCMRIVSDIELELDNADCQGPTADDCNHKNGIFSSLDSPPPPPPEGTVMLQNMAPVADGATEHFVYVMSPSRVESMIDISSDEEATLNGN